MYNDLIVEYRGHETTICTNSEEENMLNDVVQYMFTRLTDEHDEVKPEDVTVKAHVTGKRTGMDKELITTYAKYKRLFREKLENVVEPVLEIEVLYGNDYFTAVAKKDCKESMEINGQKVSYSQCMMLQESVSVENLMRLAGMPHLSEEAKKQINGAKKFQLKFTTTIESVTK